jgi:hypothetical protein
MTSDLMKFNIPEWCGSIYFFEQKICAPAWAGDYLSSRQLGSAKEPKNGAQRQKKRNPKRRKTGRKPDPCRRPFGTDQYHPISSEKRQRWVPPVCLFSPLPAPFHSWRRLNSLPCYSLQCLIDGNQWPLSSRTSFIWIFSKIHFHSFQYQRPRSCQNESLPHQKTWQMQIWLFLERSALKRQSTCREIGGLGQIVPPATSSLFFHLGLDYLKGSKAIEAVCSTLHQFLTFSFISFQASFFVEQRPLLAPCSVLDCQKTRRQCFSGPRGEREHFVCVETKV